MLSTPLARGASADDLLSITDLGRTGVGDVIDHALVLKSQAGGPLVGQPLAGRQIALLFDKPSLRTRVSFEVGIRQLGGATTTLSAAEVGLGTRESVADIARTLSRYVDGLVVRIHDHADIVALADAADIPVVNALTDREHPCQALADLVTLREHLGGLAGRRLAFIGDGNNVCHSLLLAGAAVGLDVVVGCPRGYGPDEAIVGEARRVARSRGATIEVVHDPGVAVHAADAVYTDVWTSMGFEGQADQRMRAFESFRVTEALMREAPRAIVLHCLPAHRGQEIDAEVIDGPRSVVFDQAENRLYAQQAVLIRLLHRPRLARAQPAVRFAAALASRA